MNSGQGDFDLTTLVATGASGVSRRRHRSSGQLLGGSVSTSARITDRGGTGVLPVQGHLDLSGRGRRWTTETSIRHGDGVRTGPLDIGRLIGRHSIGKFRFKEGIDVKLRDHLVGVVNGASRLLAQG
jgi:hypothetical protein